jgi:hypothetical protein
LKDDDTHDEGAQAPWCALIDMGTGDWHWDCQDHSFEDCYRRGNILPGQSRLLHSEPIVLLNELFICGLCLSFLAFRLLHMKPPFDRVSVRRRGLFLFAEIYKCKSSGQRVQKSKVAPNIRARVTINIENKARPHSSATLSQSESANIDMVLSLVAMKAVNVRMCRFLNVPMF